MRRPYGSAEGNLYNFAYYLYNLIFLKESNQLTQSVQTEALAELTLSYQRQLSYMSEDGSFSMFRDYREPTPSVWLTAFALETLSDANEADWINEFYVSVDLLNKISLWLTRQQNPSGKNIARHKT